MTDVLVTVSGTIPEDLDAQIADGRRPRADYRQLAAAFDADLLDHAAAFAVTGRAGRLLGRVAGANVVLAWACFRQRKRYRTIFSDGEQVGLPYAALCWTTRRRPLHVMIGHLMSPRKKVLLHRALRLDRRIDTIIVYASAQRRFVIDSLGYPPDRVVLSTFMVDTDFWRPEQVVASPRPRPMICAVGQEFRDYPTLVDAVRGLDVDVVIAAASPWSKRADTSAGIDVPDNVTVGGFNLYDLRQLYADATLVVVPLAETDFQAGITTILEAMSMGRAVVCTRTTGQTDTIADGVTGVYVPPEDPAALRAAIERLLADDALRTRLADAAQTWVRDHAAIDAYADRLSPLVRA
jgi:glycosyltransferase involved in cell wall biosynthesis